MTPTSTFRPGPISGIQGYTALDDNIISYVLNNQFFSVVYSLQITSMELEWKETYFYYVDCLNAFWGIFILGLKVVPSYR